MIPLIPAPAPAAIRASRESAGLSQAQAGALLGATERALWSTYERGARRPDAARWTLWLLATGQHPTHSVIGAPDGR